MQYYYLSIRTQHILISISYTPTFAIVLSLEGDIVFLLPAWLWLRSVVTLGCNMITDH